MRFEEIKELHEMGFSADQIMALRGGEPEQTEEEPEEQTEPAEPQETETHPDQDPFAELRQTIETQARQIDQLTKQIQKNNRQTARVETMPEPDLMTETDKIMAELIRPTLKEVK